MVLALNIFISLPLLVMVLRVGIFPSFGQWEKEKADVCEIAGLR